MPASTIRRAKPRNPASSRRPVKTGQPWFLGTADVAQKKWTSLRNPSYRDSMYRPAYEADLKRWGGELTPAAVDIVLKHMRPRKRQIPAPETLIHDYRGLSDASEAMYAEPLPTLRFWFHYVGASGVEYIIGGVPDGISDEYCYEFKSPSGSDQSVADNREKALRQAELYSFALRRPNLKVQLVRLQRPGPFPFKARELKLLEKFEPILRPASTERALGILDRMDQALSGGTSSGAA